MNINKKENRVVADEGCWLTAIDELGERHFSRECYVNLENANVVEVDDDFKRVYEKTHEETGFRNAREEFVSEDDIYELTNTLKL